MTSGDLLEKVTVQIVYTEQEITPLQRLGKFGKPNYTVRSKNFPFQNKNGHKTAILSTVKILKRGSK